jgi:hypothetical protein
MKPSTVPSRDLLLAESARSRMRRLVERSGRPLGAEGDRPALRWRALYGAQEGAPRALNAASPETRRSHARARGLELDRASPFPLGGGRRVELEIRRQVPRPTS